MSSFICKLSSWRRVQSPRGDSDNPAIRSDFNACDFILTEIYKIIIWKNIFCSSACLICVNIVFWIIIYFEVKLYQILIIAFSIMTFFQLWGNKLIRFFVRDTSGSDCDSHVDGTATKSDLRSSSVSEECDHVLGRCKTNLGNLFNRAKQLRQNQPGLFCILTCLFFLSIGKFGKHFVNFVAFYILLMLFMTVPGLLYKYTRTRSMLSVVINCLQAKGHGGSDLDSPETESFIPELSDEAMELLRLAGEVQSTTSTDDERESRDLLLERINAWQNDESGSFCGIQSYFSDDAPFMSSLEPSLDASELDVLWGVHSMDQKSEMSDSESLSLNRSPDDDDDVSSDEEFARDLKLDAERKGTRRRVQGKGPGPGPGSGTGKASPADGADGDLSSDSDSFEIILEDDM